MSIAELNAVTLSVRSPVAARPAVRFGMRHLFEIMTYVAIAAWTVQGSATYYDVYGDVQFIRFFVVGGLIGGASLTVLLWVFLFRVRTLCRLWMVVLAALALRQTILTHRLAALRAEVESIIDYVDAYRVDGGPYPADLSQYRFHRPELAPYIEYRDAYPVTSYEIRWHPIAVDGIAHWYSPDFGHYYEDD
jgi:hypothetical protein